MLGAYLTHLVRAGWARGLKTSVIAFDIAQFFPSLNHEFLLAAMRKQGFSPGVIRFFESYLVQRFTRYCWNNFKSDPMQADVGVGQGSGLSPVLSALYIAPVMKLYDIRASEFLDTTLFSYVDDGTIITQSRHLGVNMTVLKSAYGVIFDLFTRAGLALEHSKTELFHFSRARNETLPSVDLGYAPYHWYYNP